MLQGVVRRKNGAAWVSKDHRHPFAFQTFPNNLCAGFHHLLCLPAAIAGFSAGEFVAVTAPCEAEETMAAYFANTPRGYRGTGARQPRSREAISSSATAIESSRFATSNVMMSPSRTAAIGPPTAASGATCPAINPRVAPENRPSVNSATES